MREEGPRGSSVRVAARGCAHGTFVPPTLIEFESLSELKARCSGRCCTWFGCPAEQAGSGVEAMNATGYGLTFGAHRRIDETIARVTARTARAISTSTAT